MKKGKKKNPGISSKIAGFFVVLLSAVGMIWFLFLVFDGKKSLPVLGEPGHTAGSFSLVNQDGDTVTAESVRHKVTVAEYFFTSCPSICPVMNKNLKELYDHYGHNPDFVILSHTVDPDRDSVPVLKAYAKRLNVVSPGWQFLTGDKEVLYKGAARDYLLSAGDSVSPEFIHTQYVALLDKQRRVRGFYDATDRERVRKLSGDIKRLLAEDSD
jgi:protein SCO1